MDRLAVIAPPVITPSEVPAGAFMLSAGLAARGLCAPIHDLSLGFFNWLFREHGPAEGYSSCTSALDYLTAPPEGSYTPHRHRSSSGVLASALKRYSAGFPGWQLSLMDTTPPGRVHSPEELTSQAERGETPFSRYLHNWFNKNSDTFDRGLVSLSYISQLPAAVEIAFILETGGKRLTVGGSLPAALKRTGSGIELLERTFRDLRTDDGRSLTGTDEPFLDRLEWPMFATECNYISSRMFVPFSLSSGCVWNRCLFCPDRAAPYREIPLSGLEKILRHTDGNAIVHLIDSAIPPERLNKALPLLKEMSGGYYGFARPENALLEDGLLERMKGSGCLMLQTGVESGSPEVLRRFCKGFSPETAEASLSAIRANGMLNYVYLLFGLPTEKDADRSMTLELVRRLDSVIDFMNVSVFNLPEKSELTERASEFGFSPGEYDHEAEVLRFYRPFREAGGSNPRQDARRFLREEFRTDPAVEAILNRTPRWFRAGHMALMKPFA